MAFARYSVGSITLLRIKGKCVPSFVEKMDWHTLGGGKIKLELMYSIEWIASISPDKESYSDLPD